MSGQIFKKDSIQRSSDIRNHAFDCFNRGGTLDENPFSDKPYSSACLLWAHEFNRAVEMKRQIDEFAIEGA